MNPPLMFVPMPYASWHQNQAYRSYQLSGPAAFLSQRQQEQHTHLNPMQLLQPMYNQQIGQQHAVLQSQGDALSAALGVLSAATPTATMPSPAAAPTNFLAALLQQQQLQQQQQQQSYAQHYSAYCHSLASATHDAAQIPSQTVPSGGQQQAPMKVTLTFEVPVQSQNPSIATGFLTNPSVLQMAAQSAGEFRVPNLESVPQQVTSAFNGSQVMVPPTPAFDMGSAIAPAAAEDSHGATSSRRKRRRGDYQESDSGSDSLTAVTADPEDAVQPKPKKQRIRKPPNNAPALCAVCQTTDSPMWRKGGDDGQQILCNRCGLFWKRHKGARPDCVSKGKRSHLYDFNFKQRAPSQNRKKTKKGDGEMKEEPSQHPTAADSAIPEPLGGQSS